MNAVIYARYSSDSQREESIEGQIRECTEYAKEDIIRAEKDIEMAVDQYKKSNCMHAIVISQTTYSLEKFYIIEEIIGNEIKKNVDF